MGMKYLETLMESVLFSIRQALALDAKSATKNKPRGVSAAAMCRRHFPFPQSPEPTEWTVVFEES